MDMEDYQALVQELAAGKKALQKMEESNQRGYLMLMQSPFAFSVMKGNDLVVTLANDLMKDFWGKGKEVEGKTLIQILPELVDQPLLGMIHQVFTTGIPIYANEILARLKHGRELQDRYFNIVYQPCHEADNSISGVTTIAYEVTGMLLARKKVEESELHFRQMTDLMPSKVSNADIAGNVIYFNKKWLDYTGMSFEELRDFGYYKIIHPDELEEFQHRFQQSSELGITLVMEMRFLNKDGDYKWHLNLASPVKDENGKIMMWIGSTTEMHEQITYKTALEKAVQERTKELEEANQVLIFQNDEKEKRAAELVIANKELVFQNNEKEKRAAELVIANKELVTFTYISSHDLQEPLRKIQTFANLVLEKEHANLSETGKGQLTRINAAANRMRALIEALLSYSQTNISERIFEDTDLNKLVEEVKIEFKDIIQEKQAVIETHFLSNAEIIPFQFSQLLRHFISNSLKFSSPDRPTHIVITSIIATGSALQEKLLVPDKHYCHISFSDNGIGFEPQFSQRIFEVFQRLHNKERYPGTGIGLAIVKRIVENHNGIITAQSELDKGVTFDIYIPIIT